MKFDFTLHAFRIYILFVYIAQRKYLGNNYQNIGKCLFAFVLRQTNIKFKTTWYFLSSFLYSTFIVDLKSVTLASSISLSLWFTGDWQEELELWWQLIFSVQSI